MRRLRLSSGFSYSPVPHAASFDRAEAIRGLLERGELAAENSPGTFARLARDERSAALNARGYRDYYEAQLVETDLESRRAELRRWIGEQRARIAYHAVRYLRWRRAERRANAHIDELLAVAKAAPERNDACSPLPHARSGVASAAVGTGGRAP